MNYDVTWKNIRKEYRQVSERRWAWVDLVDVSVESLAISATVALPEGATAATAAGSLQASEELKQLVSRAQQAQLSTAFQLTIEEPKAALAVKTKGKGK
jgi:hypothetical protein